jgi:DNA-binding FadR family transcriptional regulator
MQESSSKIRVPKTAELVAAKIRKSIIRGELTTGDNLPSEAQLIQEYEISRPTIREAIRILESEDLISVSRGARGGAKVTQPTPFIVARAMGVALQSQGATIGDVYAARTMIEPAAAKMAAEQRGPEAADALQAHIYKERAELAGGQANLARGVAEFHRILVEQSANMTLALIATALHGVIEKHQALVQRSRSEVESDETRLQRLRIAYRSQEKLVELIRAGDGPGAEAHWRKHMEKAAEVLLNGVAQTAIVDILD